MTPARLFACLFALLLAPPLAMALSEDDLLPVEQAFASTLRADADGQVHLHFAIAEGYYLYRHRLGLAATGDEVEMGELVLPDGTAYTDEFFGDVETYRHELNARAPLLRSPRAQTIELELRFQGCADVGVCYPPERLRVPVALPALTTTTEDFPAAILAPPPASAGGNGLSLGSTGDNPLSRLLGGGDSAQPLQDPLPGGREPPLPEEQAFVFEAIAFSPTELLARFSMPRGYYLYRDNTVFTVTPDEARLAAPAWPAATPHIDDHFGDVHVYFDLIEVPITIAPAQAGTASTVELRASFQGCQLDGICYPPMNRSVRVDLPAADAQAHAAALAATQRDPNPTIAPMAQAEAAGAATGDDSPGGIEGLIADGGWLALGAFFVAGLLLAFTPCVLPMVPILSGLIAGAGAITTRRAFVLSLVYVLSTAIIFTAAGVVAGLAGHNLQALFQKPWILISFAGLFVLLSFSMFGFYELQLPARWQTRLAMVSNRQGGGSLRGVAIMGVLSALIVGPCVAPPLAAAVAYIGQTGDPVFGGSALFALAMGMGTPLLVVGTGAGHWLPRAGAWMETVKAVFGVAFLFLAWWMLERILPPAWTLGLLGALLIGCGVYLGALQRLPEHVTGWRKLWQSLGLILLVLGAAQLVGALSGGQDYLKPLARVGAGTSVAAVPGNEFRMVRSSAELDAALARAQSERRTVLFDFYADWCVECKRMERYTFPEAAVQQALQGVTMLKVDVTDQNGDDVELQRRFGIIGPPATLFFRDQDELRPLRLVGYEAADAFAARIERAKAP